MFANKDTPYSRENDCCSSHEETVKTVQLIACHETFLGYFFTVCNPLCSTPRFSHHLWTCDVSCGPDKSGCCIFHLFEALEFALLNLPCWMRSSSIAPRANPQARLNPSKKLALQCKKYSLALWPNSDCKKFFNFWSNLFITAALSHYTRKLWQQRLENLTSLFLRLVCTINVLDFLQQLNSDIKKCWWILIGNCCGTEAECFSTFQSDLVTNNFLSISGGSICMKSKVLGTEAECFFTFQSDLVTNNFLSISGGSICMKSKVLGTEAECFFTFQSDLVTNNFLSISGGSICMKSKVLGTEAECFSTFQSDLVTNNFLSISGGSICMKSKVFHCQHFFSCLTLC